MPPPLPQHCRVDLTELKNQISRRLGPERSQRYFSCLKRLLSQKLSKSQFDRLCFAAVGRENIPLHNQFIRSILRNATQAKVPPAEVHNKDALKPTIAIGKKSPSIDAGFRPTSATVPLWSNGKSRSTSCKIEDQPSPLGANGKSNATVHKLQVPFDAVVAKEDGDLFTGSLKRQHQQEWPVELPLKKIRVEKSLSCDQITLHGKNLLETVALEDEKLKQSECAQSIRGPLRAPLGIPHCSASTGGSSLRATSLPTCSSSHGAVGTYYSGELCCTEDLRKHMEQIADAQGLGGVTIECANLLNTGLDAYLKHLIRSCVELGVRSKSDSTIRQQVFKQQSCGKIINGIQPENHMYVQSSAEGTQEQRNYRLSLLDFRVAMELNPQQLGEDWPLLLEKVCLHSFEK